MTPGSNGKITPFLWFNGQVEEAARFYVSLFGNSKIETISHWGEGAPAPKGSVMSATVNLDGLRLHLFNGGPEFSLTTAFSLMVSCEDQREIDELWDKLSEGGEKSRCGWLTDRFGVSWQIIPKNMGELLKSPKAIQAMMTMDKIDVAKMEQAARQR